ncbi:hypothetical protein [Kytococcus sp. Marseille-QA3725]
MRRTALTAAITLAAATILTGCNNDTSSEEAPSSSNEAAQPMEEGDLGAPSNAHLDGDSDQEGDGGGQGDAQSPLPVGGPYSRPLSFVDEQTLISIPGEITSANDEVIITSLWGDDAPDTLYAHTPQGEELWSFEAESGYIAGDGSEVYVSAINLPGEGVKAGLEAQGAVVEAKTGKVVAVTPGDSGAVGDECASLPTVAEHLGLEEGEAPGFDTFTASKEVEGISSDCAAEGASNMNSQRSPRGKFIVSEGGIYDMEGKTATCYGKGAGESNYAIMGINDQGDFLLREEDTLGVANLDRSTVLTDENQVISSEQVVESAKMVGHDYIAWAVEDGDRDLTTMTTNVAKVNWDD